MTDTRPTTIAATIAAAAEQLAALDIDESVTIAAGWVSVQCGYGRTDEDRVRAVRAITESLGGGWTADARSWGSLSFTDSVGEYHLSATINGVDWKVWCPLASTDTVIRLQAQIDAAA